MYLQLAKVRVLGLALGLAALAAIILVSHVYPELAPIVVPVGVVGLLIALGLGLTSAKPAVPDAELLRRLRDGAWGSLTNDEHRRIAELWDAALLRFIRRRYRCGSDVAEQVLEEWVEYARDRVAYRVAFTDDGEVSPDDHVCRMTDFYAARIGLTPR